ncbi:NAD-dependent epimerase [Streptomyces pluripotens]|uniref:NAD-dependent epimerase n=1 Tax=Streptomyces pluripotens TaxID=1355015 RepID=A0A221NTR4_9ACTN|nr:NAD-dependent epimerase/dehydratase family protein [Streptomyces pluripotens]ARP73913.1 NAD-dependent epimerase [Streptomyces pluripotens]ASN23302.1 NAD-dependent epimerase [Streptomyces pluripotens]
MLVCVTGGTGFVGSHSVAAILRLGARVRILARDPAGVDRALRPLGIGPAAVKVVTGDVTDAAAVARAVDGADAVLHAASVYSFDSRRRAEMRRTNVRGTQLVLSSAVRAGADPVVHVSTVGALYPAAQAAIRADSPLGMPHEAYLASKSVAEGIARLYQEEGAPVVITYPPALLGPHDPHLGDQNSRLRNALRGLMPVWPGGGFPVGDVRDTAELHAALLAKPAGAQERHFGPNRYLTTRQYVRILREVTGRGLPAVFLPARAMLPLGALTGVLQRIWPWHIPAEHGAVYTCAHAVPVGPDVSTYGIGARPTADTMADTVRWLHGTGRISARQAGSAAAVPEASRV